MKLITPVKPVTNAKKRELERALDEEKKHFRVASQEAVEAMDELRSGFSVKNLIEDYPIEIAITILLSGFAIARWVGRDRSAAVYEEAQAPDLP